MRMAYGEWLAMRSALLRDWGESDAPSAPAPDWTDEPPTVTEYMTTRLASFGV